MFDGDLDTNNEVIQNNENENSDNGDGFQHVTYVNNGAVISSSKSSQLAATAVKDFNDVSDKKNNPSSKVKVNDEIDYQSESIDDNEALVFVNPQFGFGNNQNKYDSPILDFDATLTGMMGALAEIQKKGDSMLGSIRYPKRRMQ